MQNFIRNAIVFTLLFLLTCCSKDFLDENLTPVTITQGSSNIYVSPDWESSSYLFKLPSVNDGDYKIVSKPSWLNIGSLSGHLSDSTAIVQCSAIKNSAFNEVGIYLDFMTVTADKKNYKVPVSYITEGNPAVQIQTTLTLSYSSYGELNLPIMNAGLGILLWNISSMPDWLVLDKARLEKIYLTPNSSYWIPLLFRPDRVSSGSLTGKIVILTNDKDHPSVTINVTADLGTPQLNISTNTISFSSTETSKTLSFSNYGDGRLIWEFQDIPEWLTISPSSGMYNPYSYYNVIFTCDRTKLKAGPNTAIVNLKTNDSSHSSYSITVTAITPGNPENLRAIDGNITDAVFNKNTNTLYYVTSSPNKLIAYDVIGRTVLNEISLGKAPTCFAISEDWTKAAVGHNGFISAVNLSSKTVTATYSMDYSIYDIAWAENDWFCCTQNGGNSSGLHWINTANGTIYDDDDIYSLDGNSIIKKVPNQDYLIGSRGQSSPSGFIAFDIATKSKKSLSYTDLNDFWFSEDGDYIFGMNLNVYRTTSSTESTDLYNTTINAIDKINTGSESYYGLQYLYHSNNYLWVIQNESYSSDAINSIYQIEDNDYTLVKKIVYDWLYQPDAETTPFNVSANYVFANSEGTEISVLSKGVSNNSWIIQFIPVE